MPGAATISTTVRITVDDGDERAYRVVLAYHVGERMPADATDPGALPEVTIHGYVADRMEPADVAALTQHLPGVLTILREDEILLDSLREDWFGRITYEAAAARNPTL